ncbi:MAG: hypothetical protein JXA71_19040 [Chitinispirillaceae bacterium]|nr:hypothetical protein [Chitinispirillaceae bacterium]
MKKFLGVVFAVGFLFSSVSAEIPDNAIGLRLGGGLYGGGAEVSYQKALGSTNRLELDLGWGGALSFSAIYQWNWNITDALNWYVGPGAQVVLWDGGVGLGIGGQIGIEYDFNNHGVPLLLSIDSRPMYGLLHEGGFGYDGALSVRYTF